jgi:Tol biopolymer transport system component
VWGTLTDGRIIATAAKNASGDPDALEANSDEAASPLLAISADGTSFDTLITTGILRAFISPDGTAIGAITFQRNLLIWRNSSIVRVNAPGRVSHVAWSPDGSRLAAAVYPPDFSPAALDNPRNIQNFLRLQNSEIYLLDSASGKILSQLTCNSDTDYNPFFSADGKQLYYTSLSVREDTGGLMRLVLDRDSETSSSSSPVQLTQAGDDPGETPLGRVGTYTFAGGSLVFERGLADGSGEIWSMRLDGTHASFVAKGRKPQKMRDGSIATITPDKSVRILTPTEVAR